MKFLRVILFVALMIGGGYCLADPLPSCLNKGLNIPYLFGNVTYIWVKTEADSKTYNSTRFGNLMTQTDWNNIQHAFDNVVLYYIYNSSNNTSTPVYKYEATGFDHVRLPLEPMAFCDSSGQVPSSHSNAKWLNVEALAKQLWKIKTAGLAAILDLHPDVRTQYRYSQDYASDIATSGKTTYPGPFKFDLATAYHQSGHTFNASTHPLVKFWASFPAQLDDAYVGLTENTNGDHLDSSKVFFEILNEPLVDLNSEDFSDDPEDPDNALRTSFATPYAGFLSNWKTIQLAAVQQVRNWNSNFRCIVTSALSEPRDLGNIGTGYESGYYFGAPYSNSDLSGYESKLIYNMHFYEPFRLTHIQPSGTHAGYHFWRDFLGQWQSAGDENSSVKNPYGRGLPADDAIGGNPTYKGHIAMNPMFIHLYNWRTNNPVGGSAVAFMINEFGCAKQNVATDKLFQNWPPLQTGTGAIGENENDWRFSWYSDARKKMQNDQYGWSTFDYTGGFASYDGKLFSDSDPNAHADHGAIKDYMKDALFLSAITQFGEGDDGE